MAEKIIMKVGVDMKDSMKQIKKATKIAKKLQRCLDNINDTKINIEFTSIHD